MVEDYKKALVVAERELDELLVRHAQGEKRIAQLRLTISGLRSLSEESDAAVTMQKSARVLPTTTQPIEDMGITDAVREILKASQFPCTVGMVRDEMEDYGYDTHRYSNIAATVSVILKRLVQQGEARTVELKDEDKSYTGYLHIPTHAQRVKRPTLSAAHHEPSISRMPGPRLPIGTKEVAIERIRPKSKK